MPHKPPGACVLWAEETNRNGYAVVRVSGDPKEAHRLLWQRTRGDIPDRMEVDHLCSTRNCLNLDHFDLVTHRENIRRGNGPCGINARKAECLRGHPFDERNTWRTKDGRRKCRPCAAFRKRRRLRRLKGLADAA